MTDACDWSEDGGNWSEDEGDWSDYVESDLSPTSEVIPTGRKYDFNVRVFDERLQALFDAIESDAASAACSVLQQSDLPDRLMTTTSVPHQGLLPLGYALQNNSYKVMRVLLDGGATLQPQSVWLARRSLRHAVETEQQTAVRMLATMLHDAQPDEPIDPSGDMLKLAVLRGSAATIQVLLNHGTHVPEPYKLLTSALSTCGPVTVQHLAAQVLVGGHAQRVLTFPLLQNVVAHRSMNPVVDLLLEAGATLADCTRGEFATLETAVGSSAKSGCKNSTFKRLLDTATELTSSQLQALVAAAIKAKRTGVLKVLLANGASEDEDTAIPWLALATWRGATSAVRTLLSQAPASCTERKLNYALVAATYRGRSKISGLLLGANANPNCRIPHDEHPFGEHMEQQLGTALQPVLIACAMQHTDVLKQLLQLGGDARVHDARGNSALAVAVSATGSSEENVQLLIQHGARPDDSNHLGETALVMAVACAKLRVALKLVHAGASVDAVDRYGRRVLALVASMRRNTDALLEALLDRNVHVPSAGGRTSVLVLLCRARDPKAGVAHQLIVQGCSSTRTRSRALCAMLRRSRRRGSRNRRALMKVLATGGIRNFDLSSGPALHLFVTWGDLHLVRALALGGSIKLESRDKNGHTPMELAMMHNHDEVATFLDRAGPTSNAFAFLSCFHRPPSSDTPIGRLAQHEWWDVNLLGEITGVLTGKSLKFRTG